MTGRSTRVRLGLVLVSVLTVAVALRAGPLHSSPLPFNPDGIVYAGHVRETVASGRFPLARMPVDDLGYTALLAVVATWTGERALLISQPAMAVVGAAPVVLAAAVARRITAGRSGVADGGTSPTALAAGLAAAVLAVDGLYLHRSMPVDEQTVGLLLVPLSAVGVARARRTGRPAWYAVSLVLALALPPIHNLDSVVFGLFLVAWAAVETARAPSRRRLLDAGVAVGFWAYLLGYVGLIERLTPAFVIQADRLVQVPGLFVAWLVLLAVGLPWTLRASGRTQRLLGGSLATAAFGLLAVNAVRPVFPGLPRTVQLVLLSVAALLLPSLIAAWALPDAARNGVEGRAMLALLGAVGMVIALSLSASLTPAYLNTIYRAQTFAHLPWAALIGVGAAGLAGRSSGGVGIGSISRPGRFAALAGVCLIAAAVSVPLAFAGPPVVPYRGVTSPGAFAAAGHAAEFSPEPWATGDHLARVTGYWAVDEPALRTPVYAWLDGGQPPSCPLLSRESWTTVGVQRFPKAPRTVPPDQYGALLSERQVVYDGGAGEQFVLSVPAGGDGRTGC